MHDLSNALKTRMKQDQLEWCNAKQLLKYVNDVQSKPVNVLYSVTVRLHDMKADSFFDIIQNLIQVPIELQVNGQRRNISLELYHSALDEQDMSPIYKFPDNVAKIPKTQTKFKNDLHPHWITHCPPTYHTQLSKLSFCEQVILRAHEIIPENTEDGSRIFLISRNKYLYNFVVDFDKNVRICIDDFIELDKNADSRHPEDIKDKNEAQVNLIKGLSLLGLFLDALFLTSAIVATCLCHDLARQVKLQNLHLVISLELVQFLLWISMIRSISGTTCTVVGFLIHFLSLSVQFIAGMSCKTSSSSASFTTRFSQFRRTMLSVLKPHLLAAILVSINICFSVHYSTSGEIGYGSWMKMCFIADSFHRILTLLVPLGVTAASTANPVLATIYERRKRLSPGNPGTPDKSECKQVYFGFCVLNLLTWLSEYYVMDTTKALYIFTVLNTIQCIFLAVCLIFICRRLGRQFTANEITLM